MGMDRVPGTCSGTYYPRLNGQMAVFAAAGDDVDHADGFAANFLVLEPLWLQTLTLHTKRFAHEVLPLQLCRP